jgi:hypothetical protein
LNIFEKKKKNRCHSAEYTHGPVAQYRCGPLAQHARGPAWPGSASAYAAHAAHGLAQLGPGLRGTPGRRLRGGSVCDGTACVLGGGDFTGVGGGGGRLHAQSGGEAVTWRLLAASDGIDGGVDDVDSEAWTALGHAWLGGNLRRTMSER